MIIRLVQTKSRSVVRPLEWRKNCMKTT